MKAAKKGYRKGCHGSVNTRGSHMARSEYPDGATGVSFWKIPGWFTVNDPKAYAKKRTK